MTSSSMAQGKRRFRDDVLRVAGHASRPRTRDARW